MALNDIDRTKVRTAAKCYLTIYKKGTARQIFDFLMKCDLRLRGNLTVSELARELSYCCKTKNFLDITFEKRQRDNFNYYYLED